MRFETCKWNYNLGSNVGQLLDKLTKIGREKQNFSSFFSTVEGRNYVPSSIQDFPLVEHQHDNVSFCQLASQQQRKGASCRDTNHRVSFTIFFSFSSFISSINLQIEFCFLKAHQPIIIFYFTNTGVLRNQKGQKWPINATKNFRGGVSKESYFIYQKLEQFSLQSEHLFSLGNETKRLNFSWCATCCVEPKQVILLIVLIELSPAQHGGQFLHEINLFYGQLRPMKIVLTFMLFQCRSLRNICSLPTEDVLLLAP